MTMPPSISPPPVPRHPRRPGDPVDRWPDLPLDPPTEPTSGGKPDWLLVAALVVIGAVVTIGALLLVVNLGDDGTGTAATGELNQPPTTAVPPTTEAPPLTTPDTTEGSDTTEVPETTETIGCPEGTQAEVCAAAAFVEAALGRPFKEFPVVEFIDGEEFQDRLLTDFDESAPELGELSAVYRSLGLLAPGAELIDVYRDLLEVGVVGFYDPETKELVVKAQELNLFARSVLVHELVHAHDDQWYELDRPEYEDTDDEVGFGFAAVVEGNARRVENLWAAGLSPDEQAQLRSEELGLLGPADLDKLQSVPQFLILLQIAPYDQGEVLVNEVLEQRGDGALDELYASPPVTSEEVLDPDRYLAGEGAISVPTPDVGAGGAEIASGAFGELVMEILFGVQITDWGGDQFVTVDAGDGVACTTVDAVGDDDVATEAMRSAALGWAEAAADRSVRDAEVGGRSGFRLVSCG